MTDGVDVYSLPYCTTCQKAVACLEGRVYQSATIAT
jgi:arsenate reductase-like glutaredoxin family protein